MARLPLKQILGIILTAGAFLLAGGSASAQARFVNPLGSTTVADIIVTATRYLLGLVGFLAMAALVWGGVLYIISLGNDQYVQQAKKVIFWAIVGLIIIMLSYVILSTVSGFLGVPPKT